MTMIKNLQSMVNEGIANDETYLPSTKTTPSNVKNFKILCIVVSKTNLLIITI